MMYYYFIPIMMVIYQSQKITNIDEGMAEKTFFSFVLLWIEPCVCALSCALSQFLKFNLIYLNLRYGLTQSLNSPGQPGTRGPPASNSRSAWIIGVATMPGKKGSLVFLLVGIRLVQLVWKVGWRFL